MYRRPSRLGLAALAAVVLISLVISQQATAQEDDILHGRAVQARRNAKPPKSPKSPKLSKAVAEPPKRPPPSPSRRSPPPLRSQPPLLRPPPPRQPPPLASPPPPPSPSPPSVPTVAPGGSCPDAAAALDAHNAYRARHRAPPLSWNSELAESSEAWALDLASKQGCRTVHSTDYTFGENLYAMKRFPKPIDGSCKTVVGDWYNEVLSFNFSTPRLFADNAGKGMGHFTQLVWRATTSVGCGTALVDFPVAFPSGTVRTGGCKVVVCRYLPPGNMPTESAFALNVLPPVRV